MALIAPLLLAACAYRFTNEHIKRPEGIRTLAVEAVWDTSREVVPHELLWQALQDAVAADGHLRLASQSSADALLRAHLTQALVVPAGGVSYPPPLDGKEPKTLIDPNGVAQPFTNFRQLTQAGEYRNDATLTASVDIEVWSLRTRTLLYRKTYPMAATFKAIRDGVTVRGNNFLRYQEAEDSTFAQVSQDVAHQVVKDLLVQ